MVNNFLNILEDANATATTFSSHEDANEKIVGVESISELEIKNKSGNKKYYVIDTNADYLQDNGKESNTFFKGQTCILEYKEKNGSKNLRNIRKNALLTILNVENTNGKSKITVVTPSLLEKVELNLINLNYKKVDSQQDNLNFPGNVFVSDVSEGKVKIQFTPKEDIKNEYVIAYRLADGNNTSWEYKCTDQPFCWLENVESKDYFVRVMYISFDDYCFFSDEVLLNFY